MIQNPKYNLDNTLDMNAYKQLFRNDIIKDRVINQLKQHKNFVPSGTNKFKNSSLSKYVKYVDDTYNDLTDIIERAKNYTQEYIENPNINIYESNVAQRIKDIQEINNVVMETKVKRQYDLPQVNYMLNKVAEEVPLLKQENFDQIETYFNDLLQYCYDNGIHLSENAQLHLEAIKEYMQALSIEIKEIRMGQNVGFEAHYKNMHDIYNHLIKEYNGVKNIFSEPNVFDYTKEAEKFRRKTIWAEDLFYYNEKSETPLTLKHVKGRLNTLYREYKPITWEEYIKEFPYYASKENYLRHLKYLKEYREYIKEEQIKLAKIIKEAPQGINTVLTPEEIQNYFKPSSKTLYELTNMINSISQYLDFGLLERKVIALQEDSSIMFMKLENYTQQAILNNDPVFKQFRNTPMLNSFLNNVANIDHPIIKELFKEAGYNDDDIQLLGILANTVKGLNNYAQLEKNIDRLIKTTSKDLLPKELNIAQAIRTTLINLKHMDAQKFADNIDLKMSEIINGIQGNVNGMDPFLIKTSLDDLIKQYNLTPIIEEELKKANIDYSHRHSSLYDTAAQIIAWEHIYKQKYSGVMIDIETTGLVDRAKLPHGNITEITMMTRDQDGNLKVLYDNRVRLEESKLKTGYKPDPELLTTEKITDKQYMDYHKIIDKPVTEEEVLSGFWNELLNLPQKTQVDTFNGSDFDWIFIDQKLKDFHIPERLTEYDQARLLHNFRFKNETLRTQPNLQEVLELLKVQDFYKDLSKDRYVLNSAFNLKLKNLILEHIDNQLELNKYIRFTGYSPKFITGIDSNFLDNIVQFIKLDSLKYPSMPKQFLDEELSEIMADIIGPNEVEKYLNVKDMLKAHGNPVELLKDSLNYELKEWLLKIYDSVTRQMADIGTLNRAWKEIPIADYLFDESQVLKYDKQILMDLQNIIADHIVEAGVKISDETLQQLRTIPMTNLTQLTTIGLQDTPYIGYRKVSVNAIKQLDLDDILITSENIEQLESFIKAVRRSEEKIINYDIIEETSDQVLKVLQDIKNSNITLEATALPITDQNAKFNYSLLEVIYNKLKYEASSNKMSNLNASKLIDKLNKKYPDIIQLVESKAPAIEISINGDKMLYQLPDYMNENYMEYAKILSLRTLQHAPESKIDALIKTAMYPLKHMQRIKTIGTLWDALWKMYKDSYKQGLPTTLTEAYQTIGKDFHKVLYAWEVNAFLKLDPESIRNYVIYANREHIINIKRPTNAYFNNRDLFAEFAMNKKALEDLNIKWKYDKNTEILTLQLDPSVKISVNKNYNRKNYYTLNGEELIPTSLPEIPKDELYNYLVKDELPKEYIDKMYELRKHLVSINPEMAGHPGRINVKEEYIHVRNNPILPHFNTPKLYNGDEYMPYFNMDMLGELNDVMNNTSYFKTDYFETLAGLSNKMMNHSHMHIEYGQFIMQGGLPLTAKVMTKLSTQDIIDMLKTNPELTLVYLKDNPKALGGFELKKVNAYTPEIIEKAKELKATIIPYNLYAEAANAINQFTYGSYTVAIWHKVISLYKRSWLANLGTILRNGVDSTMKTFAEGKSVDDTLSAYTKAFDLLNKYDRTAREIRKLDAHGRYRLDLAEQYFKTKPNTLLDKDTYHFIYDFMEHAGMNTMVSTVDGLFGVLMKPMSDIERISRFAMYLNLEGQGETYANIMRRIAQTHFDYGLKSYGQFIAENYIPFITYVTNNINYLVHLVEENPSFLKNYFNFYQPIWDFDSYNYDELAENSSLQYQMLNGNLPLHLFGYKDKKITRTINTKYGPREQEVVNTATIRMGSSILDAIQFFISPYYNIKEKLAPPIQLLSDSIVEFGQDALGNASQYMWNSYQETEEKYQKDFGSSSIQAIFRDPSKLINIMPYMNIISQRYMHRDSNNNLVWGSTTKERTQNDLLGLLSSVFGATNRWGEFKTPERKYEYKYPARRYTGRSYTSNRVKRYYPKRVYPKKTYAKKYYTRRPMPSKTMAGRQIYYPRSYGMYSASIKYKPYSTNNFYAIGKTPYNNYTKFIYRAAYPNKAHNPSTVYRGNLPKLQSIPQYLHSYNGLNRYGKSKLLSWMNMSTKFKVKTTLKRQARAHSLYKRF